MPAYPLPSASGRAPRLGGGEAWERRVNASSNNAAINAVMNQRRRGPDFRQIDRDGSSLMGPTRGT